MNMLKLGITGASAVWSRSVFVLSLPAQVFGCSFYDGILLIPPYALGIMHFFSSYLSHHVLFNLNCD